MTELTACRASLDQLEAHLREHPEHEKWIAMTLRSLASEAEFALMWVKRWEREGMEVSQ